MYTRREGAIASAGLAGLALVVALMTGVVSGIPGMGGDVEAGDDDTTTTTVAPGTSVPDDDCNIGDVHYFAYDTADAKFGPAVQQRDVEEVREELSARRSQDPALVVAHSEYAARDYSSPEERDAKVAALADDHDAWCQAIRSLEEREASAVKVEVRHIETDNQSMWMADTSPRPFIYAGPSDVTRFDALVFTYEDGTTDVFKLDCGFQPMAPEFPGMPPAPPPPGPTPTPPPTQPPGTVPPAPTTTVPGTTTTTTVPGTTTTTTTTTTTVPSAPTTTAVRRVCPPDMPYGEYPNCKDRPDDDVQVNPSVPPQVQGPGSTPVGEDPGPATDPVDSDTGCDGRCDGAEESDPSDEEETGTPGSGTDEGGGSLPPGGNAGVSNPEDDGVGGATPEDPGTGDPGGF